MKKEETPFEPIVIDGQIVFKLTFTEDEVKIDFLPGRSEELAAILIAKVIQESRKKEMESFKKAGLVKSADVKKHFNGRYDAITKGIISLQNTANDIILTLMNMAKIEDNNAKLHKKDGE